MRCPKCHYLSFDPEPRCRNCGYDLEVADSELALKTAEPDDSPMPDLALREPPSASHAPLALDIVRPDGGIPVTDEYDQRTGYEDAPDADEPLTIHLESLAPAEPAPPAEPARLEELAPFEEPAEPVERIEPVELIEPMEPVEPVEPVPARPAPVPRLALVDEPPAVPPPVPFRSRHTTTTDLPLFVKGISDYAEAPEGESEPPAPPAAPLPPPRPPLAVRRAVAEPALRPVLAERRLGPLDRDLLEDLKRVELEEAVRDREQPYAASAAVEDANAHVEPARRALAAAVDVAVLGGIAAFVFWATLRLCGIGIAELEMPALIPLLAFIVVMDVTYLFMFTAAGGQTVGKMWMGIRVVDDEADPGEPVSLQQASWRAALTLVSVVGLGLGWLPALFGRGITLHDRLAHTRVVRV